MIPKNSPDSLRRRAIRVGKKRFEKQILASVKESRRLHRARFDAPVVELEKPYQRGYMRYFRLGDRATRRPDLDSLEELLRYVNHVQLCRKGKFEEWSPRRNKWAPYTHRTRRICLWMFLKLRVPEKLFRYFRFTSGIRIVNPDLLSEMRRKQQGATLEVNCEHLFESITVPYYVTHQRVELPEVRSREACLEEWLEQCQGWQKYYRINGHRVSRWWRYDCYIRRLRRLKKIEESEMRAEVIKFNERWWRTDTETNEMAKGTTNVVPFDFLKSFTKSISRRKIA